MPNRGGASYRLVSAKNSNMQQKSCFYMEAISLEYSSLLTWCVWLYRYLN